MVTLDDLFGEKKDFGPRFLNLKNEGEFVKGTITHIDEEYHSQNMVRGEDGKYKPGKKKYWVNGKPTGLDEEEAKASGVLPVTETVLTLSDVVGQWKGKADDVKEVRISVTGSKREREALKAAMLEVETKSFDVGDVFGKKLDERDGNDKIFSMKIVPQA